MTPSASLTFCPMSGLYFCSVLKWNHSALSFLLSVSGKLPSSLSMCFFISIHPCCHDALGVCLGKEECVTLQMHVGFAGK